MRAIPALAVALLIGLPLFHLARGGEIPIPFSDRTLSLAAAAGKTVEREVLAPGFIRAPISARAVPAYAMVTRDDLIHPATRGIATFVVREDSLPDDVLRDPAQIIGRVLKDAKSTGYLFRERDFMEAGTRPGIVAGIPAGKRAFRVDAARIHGLFGLAPGDRFDLVATIPIDADPADAQLARYGGVHAPQFALDASFQNLTKKATVRVLVQNATVVSPLETRAIPVSTSSLAQGQVTRTKPVQELVIAILPDEIAPLTEALALEAEITACARSGRPDDPLDSVTPDLMPRSPFGEDGAGGMRLVETIGGSSRQMLPVPRVPAGDARDERSG